MGEILLLCLAGFAAGMVNSVAGGGALILFPLLLSLGVPSTNANATTSVGVFGGQSSSAFGYRNFLKGVDKRFYGFLLIGLIGGALGAMFLDKTSDDLFTKIAPWFIVFATLALVFQTKLQKTFVRMASHTHMSKLMLPLLVMVAFVVSIYGGYFGAGMGIVFFAVISLLGLGSVHLTNGMKNLMTIAVNLSANIYFILAGMVVWRYAMPLLLASICGGYIGSKTASRLPPRFIKIIVASIGAVASIILFMK